MKKTLSVLTLVVLCMGAPSLTWAATVYVDDFEGYADTAALEATWTDSVGAPVQSLSTSEYYDGSQSMEFEYTLNMAPWANYVEMEYGTPQDWSPAQSDNLSLWYKGDPGNSAETLSFRLWDSSENPIGASILFNASTTDSWTQWQIDLSSYTEGNGLSDVKKVQIGLEPDSYGTGTVFFDLITVDSPTAVSLISFEALPVGGDIRLAWETASETDNAGFHIHRSDTEDGPYARITETIIPAEGGATWGASYAWVDEDVFPGKTYYYKLEDIDNSGNNTMHGPESATAPFPCGTVPRTDGSPWASVMYLLPLLAIFVLRERIRGETIE